MATMAAKCGTEDIAGLCCSGRQVGADKDRAMRGIGHSTIAGQVYTTVCTHMQVQVNTSA